MRVRCDSISYFNTTTGDPPSASIAFTPIGDDPQRPQQFAMTYPRRDTPVDFFPNKEYDLTFTLVEPEELPVEEPPVEEPEPEEGT